MERYLQAKSLVKPCPPEAPSHTARGLAAYGDHLREFRGLAPHTIGNPIRTATEFLESLEFETHPTRGSALTASAIEHCVRNTGRRLSRASLQHTVAALRSFLRFLATQGDIRPGLDRPIDRPRLYRLEQLPRALPWDTVQAFLRSIDRTTPIGLRDYTLFFLMATYGLRAGEIVARTLDDIDWRAARIQVTQPKTGRRLELPLTDEAGTALLHYLRRVQPHPAGRELFLRARAPRGPLTSTAVTRAFQARTRRSGLPIPLQGSHSLRHYAESRTMPSSISKHTLAASCMGIVLGIVREIVGSVPGQPYAGTGLGTRAKQGRPNPRCGSEGPSSRGTSTGLCRVG